MVGLALVCMDMFILYFYNLKCCPIEYSSCPAEAHLPLHTSIYLPQGFFSPFWEFFGTNEIGNKSAIFRQIGKKLARFLAKLGIFQNCILIFFY